MVRIAVDSANTNEPPFVAGRVHADCAPVPVNTSCWKGLLFGHLGSLLGGLFTESLGLLVAGKQSDDNMIDWF